MTLIAVHKQRSQLFIAADSRYSLGEEKIDTGAKIFQIPVTIYGARDHETGNTPKLLETSIGLAFTGNTVFLLTFKSVIEGLLANVQVTKSEYANSELIKGIIKNTYRYISNNTAAAIDDPAEIILIIQNSQTKLPEGVLFRPKYSEDYSTINDVEEVVIDEGYSFYGSGADTAKLLSETSIFDNILSLTKKAISVCGRNGIDSVGGLVQAGKFDGRIFRVMGVEDYEIIYGPTGFPSLEVHHTFRGVKLHNGNFLENIGVNYTTIFLQPFRNEIELELQTAYKQFNLPANI